MEDVALELIRSSHRSMIRFLTSLSFFLPSEAHQGTENGGRRVDLAASEWYDFSTLLPRLTFTSQPNKQSVVLSNVLYPKLNIVRWAWVVKLLAPKRNFAVSAVRRVERASRTRVEGREARPHAKRACMTSSERRLASNVLERGLFSVNSMREGRERTRKREEQREEGSTNASHRGAFPSLPCDQNLRSSLDVSISLRALRLKVGYRLSPRTQNLHPGPAGGAGIREPDLKQTR